MKNKNDLNNLEENKTVLFLKETFGFDFNKYETYQKKIKTEKDKFDNEPFGRIFKKLVDAMYLAYSPWVHRVSLYYDTLVEVLSQKTTQDWSYKEDIYVFKDGEWKEDPYIWLLEDEKCKIISTFTNGKDSFDVEFAISTAFGSVLIDFPSCIENEKVTKEQYLKIQDFLKNEIKTEYTKKRIEEVVNRESFLEGMLIAVEDELNDELALRNMFVEGKYIDADDFINDENRDLYYKRSMEVYFDENLTEEEIKKLEDKYYKKHDKNVKKLEFQVKLLKEYYNQLDFSEKE